MRSLSYEADEADVRKLFRHIPDVVITLERGSATVNSPRKTMLRGPSPATSRR